MSSLIFPLLRILTFSMKIKFDEPNNCILIAIAESQQTSQRCLNIVLIWRRDVKATLKQRCIHLRWNLQL